MFAGLIFFAVHQGNAADGYNGEGTVVKLTLRSPSCFVYIHQDSTDKEQKYQEGSYNCFSLHVGDKVSIKNGIISDITEAK